MRFAHKLMDEVVDEIIHGHSFHHVKCIEEYRGKLILYGSDDFLNDYDGISGNEHYMSDLSEMYFASIEHRTRQLVRLQMTPTQMNWSRVNQGPVDCGYVFDVHIE